MSELAGESLMDSANLAIVLAPNIMRPHIDIITAAQGNPLKNQTGGASMLVHNDLASCLRYFVLCTDGLKRSLHY